MKSIAEHMSFYEAYHKHPLNKATHFVGIPMIVFSILVALGWVSIQVSGFPVSLAMVLVVVVMGYYLALEPGLALGMAFFIFPALYFAHLAAQWPFVGSVALAVGLFVLGWIIQIIGHTVFEKRRPAFTDNLFQLIIGPIFLVAEVIYLLGFKHTLRDHVKELAEAHLPAPSR
jgi:uncharacterized membrane protein YGL010W